MVAWQNSMNGGQMQQLASYILSLQGTNPPGAKEPQGEKAAGPAPSDSTATASADTTVKNNFLINRCHIKQHHLKAKFTAIVSL
jgi:cytochrome c oxidase cbb3-type subunit 3